MQCSANQCLNRILEILTCKGNIAQKTKFSVKDFFRKCDQIRRKLRILSHLLNKPLMENFTFCAAKQFLKKWKNSFPKTSTKPK